MTTEGETDEDGELLSGVTAAEAVCEDLGVKDSRVTEDSECAEPAMTV